MSRENLFFSLLLFIAISNIFVEGYMPTSYNINLHKINRVGKIISFKAVNNPILTTESLIDNSKILGISYITDNRSLNEIKSGIGHNLESSPALVLNADYTPLSFMPLSLWYWQDSLKAVITGKANVISEYNIIVRSVRCEFRLPSVIALTDYQRIPTSVPTLSRRNIYLRDGFKCQYCSELLPPDDLTLDHVVPRSKGGKLTWLNTVSACKKCNVKKGDILPEDLPRIGMRLRTTPREPSHFELQTKCKALRTFRVHPHWEDYI